MHAEISFLLYLPHTFSQCNYIEEGLIVNESLFFHYIFIYNEKSFSKFLLEIRGTFGAAEGGKASLPLCISPPFIFLHIYFIYMRKTRREKFRGGGAASLRKALLITPPQFLSAPYPYPVISQIYIYIFERNLADFFF